MEKERLAVKEIELKLEDATLSDDKGRIEKLENYIMKKARRLLNSNPSSKKNMII